MPKGRVAFKSVLVASNSKLCSLEYLQLDYCTGQTRPRRTRLSNIPVLARNCATHGSTTWRFDGLVRGEALLGCELPSSLYW